MNANTRLSEKPIKRCKAVRFIGSNKGRSIQMQAPHKLVSPGNTQTKTMQCLNGDNMGCTQKRSGVERELTFSLVAPLAC